MRATEGGGFRTIKGNAFYDGGTGIHYSGGATPRWTPASSLLSAVGESLPIEKPESTGPNWVGGGEVSSQYRDQSTFPEAGYGVLFERWQLPDESECRGEDNLESNMGIDVPTGEGREVQRSEGSDPRGTTQRCYNLFFADLYCPKCVLKGKTYEYDWTVGGLLRADTEMGSHQNPYPTGSNEYREDELSEDSMPECAILYACGHTKIFQNRGTRRTNTGRHVIPPSTQGEPNTPGRHEGQQRHTLSPQLRTYTGGHPKNHNN